MSTAEATESRSTSSAILGVARRIPATLAFIAVILVVGIAGQGLWRPLAGTDLFDAVAYGLPALEQGRWWTPITGTFFVIQPWVYIPTILGFWGMAYLEHRRGWRVALLYYWIGQLFAILGSALLLTGGRALPWPWAQQLAQTLDVGASGGTMACIAAAIGLFAAPWRQRAWFVVLGFAAISLLYLGTLADVEHALAILLVLSVDRSLRVQRTTVHEQRMLAVNIVVALGIVQLIVMLLPTNGPFGTTDLWLETALPDVLFDTAVILVIAAGLWRGRRWAWIIAIILAAINIIVGGLAILLHVLLLVVDDGSIDDVQGDLDVTVSAGILWFAYLVFLIVTRAAFRVWRRPRSLGGDQVSVDDVKQTIRDNGGGTLSWMTTWDNMEYLRTSSGGIVPFQLRSGAAIALADPLGPPEGHADAVREFIDAAEAHAVTPCFFSASARTRELLPDGWQALTVADDTIIDLAGLTFQGKAWARVRQSFSRAEREGMTFRLTTLAEVSWGTRQQLRAISESWVGDKGLPEMRFTLGTLHEAEDPEVRLALAISPEGDVDGLLSWLPVYGAGGRIIGWTLDLMRRRDGGFGAVMEFLIGSSAKAFSEEGAEILSLSGAPLAHESPVDEGAIASLLSRMGGMLEPVYGFRSLHQFKKKFNPRYEPIYLLYRDEGDLARIGSGLTRAFLPDATLRQLTAAGVDLIRS
ncbi:bifunctional lysylphosphatidylglycerol flippase/synthetase MprF [Microbacterium sp. AGC85]